jgi:hypothetical protein
LIPGEAVRFAIISHHFHTITHETLKMEKIESDLERFYHNLKMQVSRQSGLVMEDSRGAMHDLLELWQQNMNALYKIRNWVEQLTEDLRKEFLIEVNEVVRKTGELVGPSWYEPTQVPDCPEFKLVANEYPILHRLSEVKSGYKELGLSIPR